MKLKPNEIKERVQAAMVILNEGSTSLEKVQSAVGLLKGVNKKLDMMLVVCEKSCAQIELAKEGAVIELATELMPADTEEEKKRKKLILVFIRTWTDLRNEVSRIQADLEAGKSPEDSSFWLSALSAAKGPLAVVTLVAIGIGVMSQTSVDVVIQNEGCSTIYGTGVPISIPGLVIPSAPIAAGQSATMTIPPLTLTVDGTSGTGLKLSSLVFSFTFGFSKAVTDIQLNDKSLLGRVSTVELGSSESHTLRLICGG